MSTAIGVFALLCFIGQLALLLVRPLQKEDDIKLGLWLIAAAICFK